MRHARQWTGRSIAAVLLFAAVFSALALGPLPSAAAVFNPHVILSDAELRDADAMSFADIVAFLARKGRLGEAFDVDPNDGLLKGAAQLIDDAAKRHRVNPKVLMTILQKESSVVESSAPTARQLEWAMGYALCDGCFRTAPLPLKFRGFAKQVDGAAGWIDWYFANPAETGLRVPGVTYVIDHYKVTPMNLATAAMYNYTPHLHGNRLFWTIWNRWFGDGSVGMNFPDGTLIRNSGTGAVALMQGGRVRAITNASVLATRFGSAQSVELSSYEFDALRQAAPGKPVRFPDLSLVRTEDRTVYLLIGARKRRIASADVFAKIGFNPEEVEDVRAEDVAEYADAEPITIGSSFPLGELLQDRKTGGIYYAEAGVKRPLWDRALLTVNFSGRPIVPTAATELAKLTTGEPVRFVDGVLLKTPESPAVYVISGGKKRAIPNEDTFMLFGYTWADIVTTSRKALDLHPTGDPLAITAFAPSPAPE